MPTVELKDASKKIDPKLKQAAIKGLRAAALRGWAEIVTFIIPSRSPQPVDRGVYRAGWRVVNTVRGAIIENLEPQAVFIEHGVKRVRIGPAMIAALAEWVVRKGLADASTALVVAKRVAFAMKRRGHIFGTSGMGILRELTEGKLRDFIDEEVRAEVELAVRRRR